MRKGLLLSLIFLLAVGLTVLWVGCKKDESTGPGNPADNSDIPANPGGVAPATTLNNLTSIGGTFSKAQGNESRIQLSLLGVTNPVSKQLITLTAGSSIWVTEDSVLKGIKITKAGTGKMGALLADVVFVVDNSGTMSQEADSIASKIIAFANYLQASGLSVQVGIVGHAYGSDQAVYGARNLTTPANLSAYLTRSIFGSPVTGLSRTVGFAGPDSARLASAAPRFSVSGGGENSIIGIAFADSLFGWRLGANRVYVCFTDEPTQPGGLLYWSTDGLIARWGNKGTIHVVFSEDSTYAGPYARLTAERPWELAVRTGGTVKFIPSTAAGLDLTTLPVTGALASTSLIEFLTSNPNASHNVVITVKDGSTADGKREYRGITY